MCAYYVPSITLIGVGYTAVNKAKSLPSWSFHSSGGFRFRIDVEIGIDIDIDI